jgi:hypothetical protein
MVFGEMFASGLAQHPADPTDPRFTEFLLEHSWRWVDGSLRRDTGAGLFDLPMGYPLPDMLAHAEPMVSFGPVLWLFRLLGFSSSSSHQLWLVAMALINFSAFYAIVRRTLALGPRAAAASAFIFTFGLSRVAQIGHSQLWPWGYFLLAVYGLSLVLAGDGAPRHRRLGVMAIAAGVVLQLWGSIYVGVFLAYVCLVTLLFGLVHPAWRPQLRRAAREAWPVALAAGAVALLCLWPLITVYGDVAATSEWDARAIPRLQPRLGSLIYAWEHSLIYGWMTQLTPLGRLPALHEQALSVGLVTSTVAVVVMFRDRHQPAVQLCAVLAVVLLVPVLVWPGGWTLWPTLREFMPVYGDLRAVGRVGLLLLIPASAAVGIAVQRFATPGGRRIWLVAVTLAIAEQGTAVPSYGKAIYEEIVQRIVDDVDPSADAFFYTGAGVSPDWVTHVDAVLAAQRVGVPTINMYTGRYPVHWQPLEKNAARGPRERSRIERDLAAWIEYNGLDPDRIQQIDQYTLWSPGPVDEAP